MSSESPAIAPEPICLKSVQLSLFSYGHANGPLTHQNSNSSCRDVLSYNIRHLPNPPRHLRINSTGLSRRLQKEFLQNDNVESFLVKVQEEVISTVRSKVGQPVTEEGNSNIEVIIAICCEEGRHRSVAFVEELSRRLSTFKNGNGISEECRLCINVTHRDIGGTEGIEQSLVQPNQPRKTKAMSRKKERREKGERYSTNIEDSYE